MAEEVKKEQKEEQKKPPRNYENYKNIVLKQDSLLYTTLETGTKNIHTNQIKYKNLKESLLKDIKGHMSFFPASHLLGKAYGKVVEGFEANIRADEHYVLHFNGRIHA